MSAILDVWKSLSYPQNMHDPGYEYHHDDHLFYVGLYYTSTHPGKTQTLLECGKSILCQSSLVLWFLGVGNRNRR